MDIISQFPDPSIAKISIPTINVFAPLLKANEKAIRSVTPSTDISYGSHARQKLDVYPSTSNASSSPILIFLYGGGLTGGDKVIPMPLLEGLVYHNMGTFFATQGYTTVIPDYRRVNDNDARTGEDAVFPSGGDDVSAVISWLQASEYASKGESRDLYIMGHSAGGIHTSTFLFHPNFLSQRKALLKGEAGLRLQGAVLLSVPCDFDTSPASRMNAISTYWPASLSPNSDPAAKSSGKDFGPCGLLNSLGKGKSPAELGIPAVLAVKGELDPEDEILGSMGRFAQVWEKIFGFGTGLGDMVAKGHNHISFAAGMMSKYEGKDEGRPDKWGIDVVAWMKRVGN
ncbi:alpha/beta-hydrolase [Athelia psychrophila]|uniref:Alpha/beta-hydrolase n=1 Tax=Athelia psychrophila TaxID=1759441 RepID=A0A166C231_9AGAM|nr:alpha/beta-hydrolase [Fibularhizoctonia sp. CBS 109695]